MIDHRSYTDKLSHHEMKWKRSKIVFKYINKTHTKIVKIKSGWTKVQPNINLVVAKINMSHVREP